MRVRILRFILFVLIVFLALPEFAMGIPSLLNGIRARGDIWSVQHDYFGDAAFLLIPGLIAVALALHGAFFARRANWVYFFLGGGLAFLMAVAIPGWLRMPQRRAEVDVSTRLLELSRAVGPWCSEHRRYPLTDAEVSQALTNAQVNTRVASKYQRGGRVLQYETVIVPNSNPGTMPQPDRPAVLYYLVSTDGSEHWVLGSGLAAPVSEKVTIVPAGHDLIVAPPCPLAPTTEPKK